MHSNQTYDFENLFTNISINNSNEALVKTLELLLGAIHFNSHFFCQLCGFCHFTSFIRR